MKQFDITAGVTLFVIACVQSASVVGLYIGQITFADYLSLWSPIMALVIGYWFRGVQGGGNVQP